MNVELHQTHWHAADGSLHQGPVHEAVGSFSVIDCEHCGFKHVVPMPTAEELRETYAHDYYSTEKPLYIQRYLEDKAWWDSVYAERLIRLEALLPASRRRLLDVGSGPGLFLHAGRERGWQVKGIEPSTQAARHSREAFGLDIEHGFLDTDTAPALGRFDALNMGEVLEHLPDPAGMLNLAHGLLDDGGALCLVVPNDFNPFQAILRDHCKFEPWWVAAPHHLNYFDAKSLAALVERCGFEVMHVSSTFPIDMFLLMGQNYIGNDALGRQVHKMRMNFEKNLVDSGRSDLLNQLHASLSHLGLGREVVLIARKK